MLDLITFFTAIYRYLTNLYIINRHTVHFQRIPSGVAFYVIDKHTRLDIFKSYDGKGMMMITAPISGKGEETSCPQNIPAIELLSSYRMIFDLYLIKCFIFYFKKISFFYCV